MTMPDTPGQFDPNNWEHNLGNELPKASDQTQDNSFPRLVGLAMALLMVLACGLVTLVILDAVVRTLVTLR